MSNEITERTPTDLRYLLLEGKNLALENEIKEIRAEIRRNDAETVNKLNIISRMIMFSNLVIFFSIYGGFLIVFMFMRGINMEVSKKMDMTLQYVEQLHHQYIRMGIRE